MYPDTLYELGKLFTGTKEYVAVKITIPDATGYEVIINPKENYEEKLAYYNKTYNRKGVHEKVPQIKIVGYSSGDTFQEIQAGLLSE